MLIVQNIGKTNRDGYKNRTVLIVNVFLVGSIGLKDGKRTKAAVC